jgi:multidrug efflux system outer membrane protein
LTWPRLNAHATERLAIRKTCGDPTASRQEDHQFDTQIAGEFKSQTGIRPRQAETNDAQYELTIQTAFREVSDALSARGTYIDQRHAQQALVEADAYRLGEMRFRSGVDNYLATLDAQRSLYAAQQGLVTVRQAELANQVTLYKALGGGWQQHTVAAR